MTGSDDQDRRGNGPEDYQAAVAALARPHPSFHGPTFLYNLGGHISEVGADQDA
jgi:hypothetical protein